MRVICQLLSSMSLDGVREAVITCLARYSLCEHLLLNNINLLLGVEGAKPLERLRVDTLLEDIGERIEKRTRGDIGPGLESLRKINVGKKTLAILAAALYATLGQLGVDCGAP